MMPRPLRIEEWPAADRAAWERAVSPPRGLLRVGGAASKLRPHTLRNYIRGYGAWLAHLAACGHVDPTVAAADRVSPERLDAWIGQMRAAGRKDSTIRQAIVNLHATLRLLAPSADTFFLLRPNGVSLRTLLPSAPKPVPLVHPEDAMDRVRAAHREALDAPTAFARRTGLRDAAIMAMFLRRAPRVSNAAMMVLGEHLVKREDGAWLVRFSDTETKNHKRLSFALDAEQGRMMDDYLRLGRPLFPGASATAAVWLGNHGRPLNHIGVAAVFRRRVHEQLEVQAGPHAARKWLESAAARHSPEAAFDAAEVCGHSPQVALTHYRHGLEIGAAQRHADRLAQLRRQTAGLAARAFDEDLE